jgi:hypothetical protein
MSTYDIFIVLSPFAVLWTIMCIGFATVHYLDNCKD